ncbi:MAG: hypothetical protein EF806_04235 [Candidatus Methanoliparum thermophilum]|uniref:Uncharacterized protein n=1 Tax=Methanoliparum thermophilum TaxID=2491083 RepID=A0A520KS11_METT2|nr:hypothetical protein [Candidatus Methanoliparum sp. LAM-1]RZN64555.1 MAG: hypothetical protein EF806_04235 [Candidatus Methanoliparum thermophilum]BDC35846.1 hypothetical protein MTLP_05280 [Candidatus Methanoliparum sp. LAM-1]
MSDYSNIESPNIFLDIIGKISENIMPMMLNMAKSIISPEMLKSTINIFSNALKAMDVRKILSSINIPYIMSTLVPFVKGISDFVLDLFGSMISRFLDLMNPFFQIIYRFIDFLSPVIYFLARPIGEILDKFVSGLEAIFGPVP